MTTFNKLKYNFESEYRAHVQQSHREQIQYSAPGMVGSSWYDVHDTYLKRDPIWEVQMGQSDLTHMMRQLQHVNWHDHVQNQYPHLREAYMEYLTQVYLTVDDPDQVD